MSIRFALAHIADSRSDFYIRRKGLVLEELAAIAWLREEFHPLESDVLRSPQGVADFARQCQMEGAQSTVIHLPIWGDPIFAVKLVRQLGLPVLLLGNARPETSSMVGMLGVGGALDQVGLDHTRVFEHTSEDSRKLVRAFVRAAAARSQLRGQTLGLFGGRSLGILTAMVDAAQWQRLFGVDIESIDQLEIVKLAEALPQSVVEHHKTWLSQRLGGVTYADAFTSLAFERQVRSYLATRQLVERHGLDFIGVKCQSELSDGYVTQCVAHMLLGGALDADGEKPLTIHACESDADGALTMQLLHLLSDDRPAALLDVRWFNAASGVWTLANCGAIPAAFGATPQDPSGLSNFKIGPHVFGKGGGGALSGLVLPQPVTLARLCRKNGEYWMAIVPGEVVRPDPGDLESVTPNFPKAFVRCAAGADFLARFGSNHIHMVSGDLTEELMAFCRLVGIPWQIWRKE
jgi:L-fucose/D-arabinose isomerase